MPADGVVQIGVDRYLLPVSVTRQAVRLLEADGKDVAESLVPNVLYDPIARTITLTRQQAGGAWLLPDQVYRVRLAPDGITAIDGARLRTDRPLEYVFRVGPAVAQPRSLQASLGEPDSVSFCKDVLPIFASKCTGSPCHSTTAAPSAGLVLDSAYGVATTALARTRVAQGSNTGPAAGTAPSEQTRFGVDMPIVQPGSPGNSWLMYKIDLAPMPADQAAKSPLGCGGKGNPEPPQEKPFTPLAKSTYGDDVERSILSDRVLGHEMPYPSLVGGYGTAPLTFQERETIRMWIARGAPAPTCDVCIKK